MTLDRYEAVGCGSGFSCAETTTTPTPFLVRTFKVPSTRSSTLMLSLTPGTVIEYKYESDLDINFVITAPSGDIVSRASRMLKDEGCFRTSEAGDYLFTFDNAFSLTTPKTVTFSYRYAE